MKQQITLLTTRETAELLRVSTRTIGRYAKAKLLTPIRLTSRTVRFRANEVKQLLN